MHHGDTVVAKPVTSRRELHCEARAKSAARQHDDATHACARVRRSAPRRFSTRVRVRCSTRPGAPPALSGDNAADPALAPPPRRSSARAGRVCDAAPLSTLVGRWGGAPQRGGVPQGGGDVASPAHPTPHHSAPECAVGACRGGTRSRSHGRRVIGDDGFLGLDVRRVEASMRGGDVQRGGDVPRSSALAHRSAPSAAPPHLPPAVICRKP